MKMEARGFVFASSAGDGRFAQAVPGQVIRNDSAAPPWIVVDHSIQSVIAAKWPGRLWEVEILQAAPEQPREDAGYTRAVAVRLGREIPVSLLFGPHGDDVLSVIEKASSLDLGEAVELGTRSTAHAREAYSRAWNAWLAKVDPKSIHLGGDHAGTLAVFAGGTRSPIGVGFTVLSAALGERARELAGDSAFITDEDGEQYLSEPWGKALDALLHAAMAFGAPELVPDADRRALTEAWEHCFGRK